MADTRSKRQKLEAMANQTASPREAEVARRKLRDMAVEKEHPIFRRNRVVSGSSAFWHSPDEGLDTSNEGMKHEDFMDWMRRASSHPKREVEPHEYVAHRGSDALGCTVCGRSKDNPHAHHTKALT